MDDFRWKLHANSLIEHTVKAIGQGHPERTADNNATIRDTVQMP